MKVKILGTGNAFSLKNYNNCQLLEEEHEGKTRRLLIDAGWALPYALQNSNIDLKSIDDIFISHAHADHIGSMEFIAFMRYDWINKPSHAMNYAELPIYAPETSPIIRTYSKYAPNLITNETFMKELWENSLKGGLQSMEGQNATLETYFVPIGIKANQKFIWQGWTCSLIQQIHIMTGSMIVSTFGLFMEKEGHESLYFVTDSQHCSPKQIEVFYNKADVIFQDCETIGTNTLTKEFKFGSGVHANYSQLAGYKGSNSTILSDSIKSKMYLTHYQDFVDNGKDFFGNDCTWDELVKTDGFKGILHVGQEFEF